MELILLLLVVNKLVIPFHQGCGQEMVTGAMTLLATGRAHHRSRSGEPGGKLLCVHADCRKLSGYKSSQVKHAYSWVSVQVSRFTFASSDKLKERELNSRFKIKESYNPFMPWTEAPETFSFSKMCRRAALFPSPVTISGVGGWKPTAVKPAEISLVDIDHFHTPESTPLHFLWLHEGS